MAPRKDTVGQTTIVETTGHPHGLPFSISSHTSPTDPNSRVVLKHQGVLRLLWTVAEQTSRFFPRDNDNTPFYHDFQPRSQGS